MKKKRPTGSGFAGKRASENSAGVAASFKIGKSSPPERCKWKPGQSGNPSGKPSAHRQVLVQAVKDMLAQVDPHLNKSLFERLLEQCARRALQGSKWHMGVLLDYGLGKPVQAIAQTIQAEIADVTVKSNEELEAELMELLSKRAEKSGRPEDQPV